MELIEKEQMCVISWAQRQATTPGCQRSPLEMSLWTSFMSSKTWARGPWTGHSWWQYHFWLPNVWNCLNMFETYFGQEMLHLGTSPTPLKKRGPKWPQLKALTGAPESPKNGPWEQGQTGSSSTSWSEDIPELARLVTVRRLVNQPTSDFCGQWSTLNDGHANNNWEQNLEPTFGNGGRLHPIKKKCQGEMLQEIHEPNIIQNEIWTSTGDLLPV